MCCFSMAYFEGSIIIEFSAPGTNPGAPYVKKKGKN